MSPERFLKLSAEVQSTGLSLHDNQFLASGLTDNANVVAVPLAVYFRRNGEVTQSRVVRLSPSQHDSTYFTFNSAKQTERASILHCSPLTRILP